MTSTSSKKYRSPRARNSKAIAALGPKPVYYIGNFLMFKFWLDALSELADMDILNFHFSYGTFDQTSLQAKGYVYIYMDHAAHKLWKKDHVWNVWFAYVW